MNSEYYRVFVLFSSHLMKDTCEAINHDFWATTKHIFLCPSECNILHFRCAHPECRNKRSSRTGINMSIPSPSPFMTSPQKLQLQMRISNCDRTLIRINSGHSPGCDRFSRSWWKSARIWIGHISTNELIRWWSTSTQFVCTVCNAVMELMDFYDFK